MYHFWEIIQFRQFFRSFRTPCSVLYVCCSDGSLLLYSLQSSFYLPHCRTIFKNLFYIPLKKTNYALLSPINRLVKLGVLNDLFNFFSFESFLSLYYYFLFIDYIFIITIWSTLSLLLLLVLLLLLLLLCLLIFIILLIFSFK